MLNNIQLKKNPDLADFKRHGTPRRLSGFPHIIFALILRNFFLYEY